MTQKCLLINLGFPPLWLVATHSRIAERFSPEESQATFGRLISFRKGLHCWLLAENMAEAERSLERLRVRACVVAMIPKGLLGIG
jgi:hypothetical protein